MIDLSEPTTPIARAALNLAREVSPPFLFNHSARSFAWACLIADKDGNIYLENGFAAKVREAPFDR